MKPNVTRSTDPKQTPAVSFAQRFVKQGGSFACPDCHAKVTTFPHRCKSWGAR